MIHKEGYISILLAILVCGGFTLLTYLYGSGLVFNLTAFISIVLFIIVLQFFRNPKRTIPLQNDRLIYAPADGKVVVIENNVENEYIKGDTQQVSIFMSPLNVHANRIPTSGEIVYDKYHSGKYLAAWNPKSSEENERACIAISNKYGTIFLRQVAGALARRIKYYVKTDDNVSQGQEYGFIKFGSRVDIHLPLDAEILVKIDDVVKGNKNVIAKFKEV